MTREDTVRRVKYGGPDGEKKCEDSETRQRGTGER